MSRKVLGLDIRANAISAVLLDSGFKGSVVEKRGCFPIAANEDADAALYTALAALVDSLKPAGAACVAGIATADISIRNLSVPFHDLKKIQQILPFELEPSLPLPVEELVVQFEAVKQEKGQDILAFAIPELRVRQILEQLTSVNLRPVAVLPGAYAVARCLSARGTDNEDFLFIDTGDGHHSTYAVCQGQVRLVRTLPVAADGRQPVQHLETVMQRTFTAASVGHGIDVEPAVVYSAGPQSDLLLADNPHTTLLGKPVKPIDCIRAFPRLKGNFQSPEWTNGQLDTALALAIVETEGIGGINFSTQRSTIQHYWSEYRGHIILTAVLMLMALATVLGGQYMAANAKQRQVAELDRRIEKVFTSTFPEVTVVVNPLQQMQIKIKEAGDGDIGLDLNGDRVRVIDILKALNTQIPKAVDIQIRRMVVGADNVMLSGTTDTFNTVDDIKGRLEKADIFASVTISSADLEKSGKRVRFKLKMDF